MFAPGGDYERRRRAIYPITGHLGIEETIGTFWYLANYDNLSALDDSFISSQSDEKGEYGRLVDQITFTTKLSGSVNPQFQDGACERTVRLTPVSVTATSSREDIHTLIIAFAIPLKKSDGTAVGSARAASGAANTFILRREGDGFDLLKTRGFLRKAYVRRTRELRRFERDYVQVVNRGHPIRLEVFRVADRCSRPCRA